MNNVNDIEDTPDFIADQRAWLVEHKATRGLVWNVLAALTGRASGSLSNFAVGKYNGGPFASGNGEIAKQVFRYRQTLNRQQELKAEAPEIPSYFETRTANEINHLLSWAHTRGRMALWVGGPGTSKTSAAKYYADCVSNVWHIELLKSTGTISALCIEVLAAMRDFTPPTGTARLSAYVMGKMRDRRGLLIFDDAQHLNIDQIEEIRGWYDRTGVGVAFLGNEKVVSRMEGGRKAEFAQLFSRIGLRMVRALPLRDDVEALADAWGIDKPDIVTELQKIGSRPGGLRSCTFALELATMLARGENDDLSVSHLKRAWAQLSTMPVAA